MKSILLKAQYFNKWLLLKEKLATLPDLFRRQGRLIWESRKSLFPVYRLVRSTCINAKILWTFCFGWNSRAMKKLTVFSRTSFSQVPPICGYTGGICSSIRRINGCLILRPRGSFQNDFLHVAHCCFTWVLVFGYEIQICLPPPPIEILWCIFCLQGRVPHPFPTLPLYGRLFLSKNILLSFLY